MARGVIGGRQPGLRWNVTGGFVFRADSVFLSAYGTVAYSARTGAQLWARRYQGPLDRPGSGASSAAVSPAGTVLVTGSSHHDYATIAYSATGRQLWVKRYNGPGNGRDDGYSVAVPGNGKVYVTGTSQGKTSGYDYATIAYNVFTGAPLWVKRYSGPGKGTDAAYSVAARAGRVFVTGASAGTTSGSDYANIAYNG